MPNYKELYFTLLRETETAIRTLIAAQQKCEEMYLTQCEEERPAQIVTFSNLCADPKKSKI